MPRDRGIEQLEEGTGDFLDIISKTIAKKGKVRILEAGCGHGVSMLGFVKRFGEKVEMVGFNLNKEHGTIKRMKKQAVKKEIFTKEELKRVKNLPKIIYCDASKKLPFKDNSFDFVYSQASVYLFDDKIHFLEECNRILKKNGIARLSVPYRMREEKQAEEYTYTFEIWDKGKMITPKNYFRRIKGVRYIDSGRKSCLEIKKQPKIDFKLKIISSIDSNFIWHKWMGVKNIYTTQIDFKPHWKC